jgi:hypothetical protein
MGAIRKLGSRFALGRQEGTMATRYAGRCGAASCAWQFSSPSPALITELYGNHFKKAHTGSAALLIEPGSLIIPWPSDSQELIRLNLAESPEQLRTRAVRQLRFASVGSMGAAAGMLLIAVLMTMNSASAAGIAALGGAPFWIGLFVVELLLVWGILVCSIRMSRSTVSLGFRRLGFALLIVASVVSGLLAILLWFGIIGIADIATSGEVPTSFTNLYFLQIVLAVLCDVALLASTAVFRNATRTRSQSAAIQTP